MVYQGLTEAALRQWDYSIQRNIPNTKAKDPPGELLRDPPGETHGLLRNVDDLDCSSAEDSTDDSDILNLEEQGDEEDDGLYIGANDGSDDSTIAFSDIVLPTEEEDPFLIELAEDAVREAVEQTQVDLAAAKEPPTEHPNPRIVVPDEQQSRAAPVPFSAHVIVAHAVNRRKQEIMEMSQEELLEQLNKRLRPYMKLPLKMPPLRQRKRPNCLFLNHLGTRRPRVIKKRKIAATTAADVQVPRKKRAMPTLPKQTTTTPQNKPNTITAPSSPVPAVKKTVETPDTVRSTPTVPALPIPVPARPINVPAKPSTPQPAVPALVLPKLLTDSTWDDDLKSNKKKEDAPAPVPAPPSPPLMAVENKKTNKKEEAPKKKAKKTKKEAPKSPKSRRTTKKRVKLSPPGENISNKKKEAMPADIAATIAKMMAGSPCPSPELAPKKTKNGSILMKEKKEPQGDPPGTTVASRPSTPEPENKNQPDSSSSCKLEASTTGLSMEEAENHEHEPLAPSFENSFHHDHDFHLDSHQTLASLFMGDDSNRSHSAPEAATSTPLHYDLLPTPNSDKTKEESAVSIGQVVPPQVLMPSHEDLPPILDCRRGRAGADAPGDRTPSTPTKLSRPFVSLEHRSENISRAAAMPRLGLGMPRPMLLSPEMDMLSPSTRYGSHPRYEVTMDMSPSSPPSPMSAHKRLSIPVRMTSPTMPSYDAERMYYRHSSHLPYHGGADMEEWVPDSPVHSSSAPFVSPDPCGLHGESKLLLEPGHDDWVTEGTCILPCPPLTGQGPVAPKIQEEAASKKTSKKPKRSRKKKSSDSPKPVKGTKKAKKAKKTSKKATPLSPPTVTPFKPKAIIDPSKITPDYSEFRKVMSLRSGRTVDCPVNDEEMAEMEFTTATAAQ